MDFVFSKDIKLKSSCVKYYQNRTVTGCMLSWQGSWVVSSVGCYLVSRSCSLQCIQSADRVKCSSVVRPCVATTDRVHTEVSSIVCRISRLSSVTDSMSEPAPGSGYESPVSLLNRWPGTRCPQCPELCVLELSANIREVSKCLEKARMILGYDLCEQVSQCNAMSCQLAPPFSKILLKVL